MFSGGFRWPMNVPEPSPPQAVAEPELEPDPGMSDEQCHAFRYWTSEAGFGVLEALALVHEGLSPSLHREFVKHKGCTPRQALRILL